MATIEDFILRINVQGEGKIKAVGAAMGDLKNDVSAFGQVGGPIGNTINGIVGRLGTMATAGLAAAGVFVSLGLKAVQLADQLQDISDATGVASGALSNLQASIIEAGGKAEDFASIATKLNQTLGDAATGGESAQKSFQKLGVFVRDATGNVRDTGDVLRDVLGKLKGIDDPATRAAMAVELLGKKGKEIDWTKVNAINDPFKDEYVAALARFQGKLDSISNSVNDGLIRSFGELFLLMEDGFSAKRLDGYLARFQSMISGMSAAEILEQQRKNRVALGLEKALPPGQRQLPPGVKPSDAGAGRGGQGGPTAAQIAGGAGDFGAIPEATIKAIAESQKRITQSGIDARKLEQLKGANDLQAIEINAAAEIAKQREEIFNKERLTEQQKIAEFTAKKQEIENKAANDIAKYQSQQNAKVYSELEAQRQKSAEELAAEETRIANIVESARQLSIEQENQLNAQKRKNDLLTNVAGLSDRETRNVQEIFNLEEERLTLLRQIAAIKDMPYEERLKRETEINEQIRQRKQLTIDSQAIDKRNAENFSAGWSKAYKNFVDDTRNSVALANRLFQKLTGGLEDYFVNRLKGMKGGWKSFVAGLAEELVRSNISKLLASVFNPDTGILGGIGKIFGVLGGAGGGGAASAGASATNPVYAYITNLAGGLNMPGMTPEGTPGTTGGGALDNIWTSVKDTASSVFDTVKGVFSSIGDTVGNIFSGGGAGGGGGFFSGLSDLFGGFFANGGMLGAGKFGIAGENGPELISGPAQVTPMGGTTNVTYNINAVDAASFKQMIAADPGFIHAVAQQGGRSVPRRY